MRGCFSIRICTSHKNCTFASFMRTKSEMMKCINEIKVSIDVSPAVEIFMLYIVFVLPFFIHVYFLRLIT